MTDFPKIHRWRIVGETWFWLIVAGLTVLILTGAAFAISFLWGWVTAGPSGKLHARQQIQSGPFRIEAYNLFFARCAAVQTLDQALNESHTELKTAAPDDKQRIRINIGAQLNDRNDAANNYNIETQQSYTVGQFKSRNLVYQIPPYTEGVVTKCVVPSS